MVGENDASVDRHHRSSKAFGGSFSIGATGDSDFMESLATGRKVSLFAEDVTKHATTLINAIENKRLLVIGGAGSIGAAVVEALCDYRPRSLHVVDISENGLVELVRSLRGRTKGLDVADFRTLPLALGGGAMQQFLGDCGRYDAILNFAALKHVRSEKDIYSLMQMLDTNLTKQAWLLRWMETSNFRGHYFCVSTDKAANPASLMGASKRVMEHLMFGGSVSSTLDCNITSARFANVAFSNGSLLQGFIYRLGKHQPLAAPRDTARYFVSHREAAHICLLAAFAAPHLSIAVPRLVEARDATQLVDIAKALLTSVGLRAALFTDEVAARQSVLGLLENGQYPVVLTPRDTSGEKDIEVFVGQNEQIADMGMENLQAVRYTGCDTEALERLLVLLDAALDGTKRVTKEDLLAAIKAAEPSFRHIDTGKNLDARL